MSFGQSTGPNASHRQVQELQELLVNAGHADFRDARGPMGFTQRQAGGKFTADEAAGFIEQLLVAEHEAAQGGGSEAPAGTPAPADEIEPEKPASELTDLERAIRTASTKSLVLEVRRRGWKVIKPN
ncbi:MAG: hypothetical protein P8J50_00030 [Acidimicrobiales bacterium]|jgi:hypothetical protein|nr:hypothetical protein [Acidimicrobiales bacterium]